MFFFQTLTRTWLSAALGCAVSCVLALLCLETQHLWRGSQKVPLQTHSDVLFLSVKCSERFGERGEQELAAVAGAAALEMGELPSHHNRMLRFLWESPPSTVPIPKECFALGGRWQWQIDGKEEVLQRVHDRSF